MSEEEVKSRLGDPIRASSDTSHIYCKCNPQQMCDNTVTHTFEYLNRSVDYPYPLVWVHFDEQRLVKEVFINKYVPDKHWAIYRVNRALCDTMDEYFPPNPEARVDSLKQFFE